MVKWNTLEAKERLMAAQLCAQSDKKLDYRKIATYFGMGTTYDAIEGQYRKIRVEAAKMKAEVESGVAPQAPPRGSGGTVKSESNCSTPRKARKPRASPRKSGGVISGRVSKSLTPTKKKAEETNTVAGLKEDMASSESSVVDAFDSMLPEELMQDLAWGGGWQEFGQEI